MSAGNRSVLVVIDSRKVRFRRTSDITVFAFLDHCGVAWQIFDRANTWEVPEGYFDRAAIIVGHDGAVSDIAQEDALGIRDAVLEGVGLISFDRDIPSWPDVLKEILPETLEYRGLDRLYFPEPCHWIATGHSSGEEVCFLEKIETRRFVLNRNDHSVAIDKNGDPVILFRHKGSVRALFFGTGNWLYAEEVYGHLRGLDGLFWRGLLQVARKPFPMRSFPPYLTARVDDCNGTHTAFQYVNCMNRFGISPNLGLFLDELGPTDWKEASRLFHRGGADFSAHAFRDDFYKKYTSWKPAGFLHDKPDLSKGGKETFFEGIGIDHLTGRDLDDERVKKNFQRIDSMFARAGITLSRILNAHYGEVGLSSLPYFTDRNVDLFCTKSMPGQLHGNQPVWRPKPYHQRSIAGRYAFVMDRIPHHPSFTMISAGGEFFGENRIKGSDILRGYLPFLEESPILQSDRVVSQTIKSLQIAFDSLTFGLIMTHEERIDVITLKEWEDIIERIVTGITGYDFLPASREYVSIVGKRLFDTRLSFANAEKDRLVCMITGVSDGPSPLTIWEEKEENLVSYREELPAINGFLRVSQ
ncbi:MAG: hypothetical protein WDA18_08680 [Candidatus Ratteibacteria bacterium]